MIPRICTRVSPFYSKYRISKVRFSQNNFHSRPPPSDAHEDFEAVLAKPSWSVKSQLKPDGPLRPEDQITAKQLQHLLRLSALPLPTSSTEEAKMIEDLQAQLHFVRAVQKVDTEGVKALQNIRDETKKAEMENTINVDSLKAEFDRETVVGRRGRIIEKNDELLTTDDEEKWDVLAQASRKVGRYFVVETDKD